MTDTTEHQPDPSSTEPLISVSSITAVGSAILAAAIAFGLHIDATQRAAVVGLVAVAAPFVVALWGRRRVYSPATVHQLLAACRPKLATGGRAPAYRPGRADPDAPRDAGTIL